MGMLEDEIATKEAIIRTLDSGSSGKKNTQDLEAIQSLRHANENLMKQLVELQRSQKYSGGAGRQQAWCH